MGGGDTEHLRSKPARETSWISRLGVRERPCFSAYGEQLTAASGFHTQMHTCTFTRPCMTHTHVYTTHTCKLSTENMNEVKLHGSDVVTLWCAWRQVRFYFCFVFRQKCTLWFCGTFCSFWENSFVPDPLGLLFLAQCTSSMFICIPRF